MNEMEKEASMHEARRKHIASFQATWDRCLWELFTTVLVWVAMFASYDYIPRLVFFFLYQTATNRLFVVFHDAGHDSFTPSKSLNRLLTWMAGPLLLTPPDWWNDHRLHHSHLGNMDAGYPWSQSVFLTKQEIAKLKPGVLRVAYKLFRHPLVYFPLAGTYEIAVRYRLPFEFDTNGGHSGWVNMMTNASIVAYLSAIYFFRNGDMQMIQDMLLSALVGQWLAFAIFHSQHVFEDSYVARNGEWRFVDAAFKGSSFLDYPEFMQWQSMGIGYHHIHHYNSKVPGYLLRECHESGDPEFWKEVTRLTLWDAIKCCWLWQYDEKTKKFVH